MCGICGVFNFNNNKSEIIAVKKMTDKMHNRGPDDEGIVVFGDNYGLLEVTGGKDTPSNVWNSNLDFSPKSEFRNMKATLALGHRRLSIIDLSESGHQPLSYANNKFWIVFNGEIYNYRELKRDLLNKGYKFVGNSDTEVILAGYSEWGEDFVKRLDGMFAFAVFDVEKKELFATRDRLGIKPFYYFSDDDKFIFASGLNTLVSSGIVPKKLNYSGLYDCFSFGVTPRPETVFSEIKSIEPGHCYKISASGKIIKERYRWFPAGKKDTGIKEKDAVVVLDELLHKAVKKRLLADVPVSSLMSGGVDSGIMTAIASEYHNGISAFTAFYGNEKEGNEVEEARAVAERYPLQHIADEVNIKNLEEILPDMIRAYEEPTGFIDPQYFLAEIIAKRDIKVVLNGLGGDELFGGYNYHIMLNKWKAIRMISPLLRFIKDKNTFCNKLYECSKMNSPTDFVSLNWSYFSEDMKQKVFNPDIFGSFNTYEKVKKLYPFDGKFSDDYDEMEFADLNNYLSNYFLYRSDRLMMRFSVEGRYPYLDDDLIDFSFKIPSSLKVKGKTGKYILKKNAESYLPPKNIYMKKKGFRMPLETIVKKSLKDMIRAKIYKLAERDLFCKKEVLKIYNRILAGKERHTQALKFLMTELWFEEFID
ncbi:MAG: asparagine synthase (glutamine-hydrolyzing) [Candidatus Cloacimonadota bacterium]|nr:MAG: asparagine synthase (glutamine-hydrolyzing) [Candidatus Cloacimonadota bacterium]